MYLDCWVKVLPHWRKSAAALTRFGFPARSQGDLMTLAPELLQILVCPKCKGDLEYRPVARIPGLPRLPARLRGRGRHSHHADRRSQAALSQERPAPRVNPHTLSASAQRALEDARAEARAPGARRHRRRAHRAGAARSRTGPAEPVLQRLGLDAGAGAPAARGRRPARPATRRDRGAGLHLPRQAADRDGLEGGARGRQRAVGRSTCCWPRCSSRAGRWARCWRRPASAPTGCARS